MHTRRDQSPLKMQITQQPPVLTKPLIEWDWGIEHEDRKQEAKADAALHGAQPFQVDRRLLKDVVREKMECEAGRIKFLSSGTFHKAYLITLIDGRELVARVARRFMPRLKTESEIATMQYIREHTSIPVPTVYYHDSNPYNRLGGEYILMSKAPGVPLSKVYHSMGHNELLKLLDNLAAVVVALFSHRFSHIGSLYFGAPVDSSTAPTPKATGYEFSLASFPLTPMLSISAALATPKPLAISSCISSDFHVGPIISWPFFGSNRGELSHPTEINRGPWNSVQAYLRSCADREISGVVRENEGKTAPHRLHLDPDEILSSRHHHLISVPGDESDDSDEWNLEESEEEWDGPGDVMYRDYRRMQRSTFLVAHMAKRVQAVQKETSRWIHLMERLGAVPKGVTIEEFGLDPHDLSLENIFVDGSDNSKITCIIDWESTTTRPLWACAHLPAFLQSSPFIADLFREAVAKLATPSPDHAKIQLATKLKRRDLPALAHEWLQHEHAGAHLRLAHRFGEWDGWEEGLAEGMLGPEEHEDEWFKDTEAGSQTIDGVRSPAHSDFASDSEEDQPDNVLIASLKRRKGGGRLPFGKGKEKLQMLDTTGDICGGRGGELGRRLEAWLVVNGNQNGASEDGKAYEAGSE